MRMRTKTEKRNLGSESSNLVMAARQWWWLPGNQKVSKGSWIIEWSVVFFGNDPKPARAIRWERSELHSLTCASCFCFEFKMPALVRKAWSSRCRLQSRSSCTTSWVKPVVSQELRVLTLGSLFCPFWKAVVVLSTTFDTTINKQRTTEPKICQRARPDCHAFEPQHSHVSHHVHRAVGKAWVATRRRVSKCPKDQSFDRKPRPMTSVFAVPKITSMVSF